MGGRVKDTQAIDFVAKEVDADRRGEVGGPDVDNPAAAGKGARLFNRFGRIIAGLHPVGRHLFQPHHPAGAQRAQGEAQLAGRQGLLHQRAGAGDNQWFGAGATLQGRERGEALLARVATPRNALIGQGIRLGEKVNRGATSFAWGQPTFQAQCQLLRHFTARGHQ